MPLCQDMKFVILNIDLLKESESLTVNQWNNIH